VEAALFPHLFLQGDGYMSPEYALHRYCVLRMRQSFSIFTLYKPYVLVLYVLLSMQRCISAMKAYDTRQKAIRIRSRNPDVSRTALTKKLLKRALPATLYQSPQWWRHQLNDMKAIVNHRGLPTFFLTLTADEFSEFRFSEMKTLERFLQQLDLGQLHCYIKVGGEVLYHIFASTLFVDMQVSWQDCPIECARAFHARVSTFLKEHVLCSNNPLFGYVEEHVIRFEAQGRGSLHVHINLYIRLAHIAAATAEITCTGVGQLNSDGTERLRPTDPVVRLLPFQPKKRAHAHSQSLYLLICLCLSHRKPDCLT
jgi:hypothetical protein